MSEPLTVYHSHLELVKPPPLPPQLVELQRACIGTLVAAYRLVGVEVRVEVRVAEDSNVPAHLQTSFDQFQPILEIGHKDA